MAGIITEVEAALEKYIDGEMGELPFATRDKIGVANIWKSVTNGYVLGGEQSGHVIFSKHATTGDGILTALMLMEVILEKKQSLGTLCQGMKMYPQLLQNVLVEDKDAMINHPKEQERFWLWGSMNIFGERIEQKVDIEEKFKLWNKEAIY